MYSADVIFEYSPQPTTWSIIALRKELNTKQSQL